MTRMEVNGADLWYEARGDGAVILGIHGTPSSAMLWTGAAERLAELGRCVIYDRRGFARSAPSEPIPALDLGQHVEDAAALLIALTSAPAVVIGRSTGGLIALELARRFPELVGAAILLEPAVFTLDPEARAWAESLRSRVLTAAARSSEQVAEVVIRAALGDTAWESLPADLREIFAAASPAVRAELAGSGMDLSADPLELRADQLAAIGQPTLIVSAEDSPMVLRLVCDRLAHALPRAETARVAGGHLIDPASPAVLDFVRRTLPRLS